MKGVDKWCFQALHLHKYVLLLTQSKKFLVEFDLNMDQHMIVNVFDDLGSTCIEELYKCILWIFLWIFFQYSFRIFLLYFFMNFFSNFFMDFLSKFFSNFFNGFFIEIYFEYFYGFFINFF